MITVYRRNQFARNSQAPTPDQDDFISYWRSELNKMSTGQILCWVADMFPSQSALVTSCGLGGSVLISLLGQCALDIPVIHPGIGSPLAETRELHERLSERFDVRFETGSSKVFVDEASLCCGEKKYCVLRRMTERFELWISEAISDPSRPCEKRSVFDWDDRFGLFRVSPLIRWTKQSILNKAIRESIPFDELADRDYFDDDCYACLSQEQRDCSYGLSVERDCQCCQS